MLFTKQKINRFFLQITDSILACVVFVFAFYLRSFFAPALSTRDLSSIGTLSDYTHFLPALAILTPLILTRMDFYNLGVSHNKGQILNLCVQSSIFIFLCLIVLQFMLKSLPSRSVFLVFVPLCSLALFLRQQFYLWERSLAYRQKRNRLNMLLVTDRKCVTSWRHELDNHPEFGFRFAREIDLSGTSVEQFVQVLHSEAVQLVVFDVKYSSFQKVVDAITACEDEGIEVLLATSLFDTHIARAKVDYFIDRPVLVFSSTPDSSWQLLSKTFIDRLGAVMLLLVFALPMLLIALFIKFTSRGPVLFRQERSGHYGRPFVMYKFRSMVSNAEQLHEELARLNEMIGPVFKVSKDPRITPFGVWLRRTSLDELPQLFNVLKGEMSLVGPRPLPVYETSAISENTQRRRLSVNPGLTCLWQIRGRNRVSSFEDWVKLDLEYIDNWSIWLDLQILILTVPAVLFGKGAK